MMIKDKKLKILVNVLDYKCPTRKCYWARQDPGVFIQGIGYRPRSQNQKVEWLCGTREVHGCPDNMELKK